MSSPFRRTGDSLCDSGVVSSHDHAHSAGADRRWLGAALAVIVAFMIGEVIAGLLAHSLALLTDAAHMLTDAAALAVAIIASRIVQRPARGAFTYGFARVDALSGQASGITLMLLAVWFTVEAVAPAVRTRRRARRCGHGRRADRRSR